MALRRIEPDAAHRLQPPGMSAERPLVIVTRAAPGHQEMAERVRGHGHDVLACPMQQREPIDEAAMTRAFDALDGVDLVVVTSPHAAGVAVRALGVDRLEAATLIAPGAGTAAELEAKGLRVGYPAHGGTSEEVIALDALARSQVAGRTVVILAAPGGRTLIADTLAERGAEVHFLAPYRRRRLAPAAGLLEALAGGRPVVTLLSSAAALDALHRSLPAQLRAAWLNGGFVVSSDRLATRLGEYGADRITLADGASQNALIQTLNRSEGRGPDRR